MASFLFGLGAKLQFKRCSGVLSRSEGFQGSGKFCLLQGLATTLWTPIKPQFLIALHSPSRVLRLAPN